MLYTCTHAHVPCLATGKGLAPKILMAAPVSALSGVCFEVVMSLSKKKPGNNSDVK